MQDKHSLKKNTEDIRSMQLEKASRLFHGNVKDAGTILFFVLLPLPFMLFFAVFSWIEFTTEKIPDQLFDTTVVIDEMEVDNQIIYFHTDDRIYNVLCNSVLDMDALMDGIDIGASFCVMVDSQQDRAAIWKMDCAGKTICTPESVFAANRHQIIRAGVFLHTILVLYLGFVVLFCYVVTNPQKHPILAKMMIRKGWRNF